METRRAELLPPLLAPNHQGNNGDEEGELDDAEGGPSPSKTNLIRVR
jgi:hypothetical protein